MKATIVFQFYLSYILPRGDDWPTNPIGIQLPDFIVLLRPRSLEEELFPETIDKTLSTMALSLRRVSLPQASGAMVVRDRCYDRIEVRVDGELPEIEGDEAGDFIQ